MGIGPIPWRDIIAYGERAHLEDDVLEAFVQIIREMDAGYLEWHAAEEQKKNKEGGKRG